MTVLGAGVAQAAPHLRMTLVAETPRPRAGAPVTLAIDTRPEAGWHGYWGENPGDAGFPPNATWTLPAGASVGKWRWPVPETLLISGLMNFVYERPYAPLLELTVPAGLKPGTALPVRLRLRYLVCTMSVCVPEEQTLALDLTVGDGGGADARFDAWRRAVPRPLGSAASYAADAQGLRIAVPFPAAAPLQDAYFFPITGNGAVDYAAPQTVTRDGDRLLIATKGKPSGAIEGVLRVGPEQGLQLRATPGVVPAAAGDGWAGKALAAFAFAVLGGLILNIMPCVFPILSLKALSLAKSGGEGARGEALAYTAGVVAVCVGLGAIILGLRAGGAATGWAFQLTDPRMVVLLLLLASGIAMNLSGLFELPTPRFAGGEAGGAFATGTLAAFVATPCSGPFMAGALGTALFLPWPAALAVFGGLGLGLALPFLAIGFVPRLRRLLPKPGAWMNRFRRGLSVPMWLTAIGLAWLLGRMAGVDGMTLGLIAVLGVGFALWWLGGRQGRGLGGGVAWAAVALVAVGAAAAVPRVGSKATAAAVAGGAEAFSEARLASLRAARKPVFAYFTADWCLTCKVNERVAIDPAGDALRAKGVAVLVGDWTDGDPALGRFIEAHNRAGVPLYLYYAPGAEARVLPQVLTAGMLTAL